MSAAPSSAPRFVICVSNEGYEASLERWKLYALIEDEEANAKQFVRLVDESGEDYLYPSSMFARLELPQEVQQAYFEAA